MSIMTKKMLHAMKHSPLMNYAGIPGLTSWLIGNPGPKGTVRLFECSREHFEHIIPHSHRFDLHCIVLAGTVENTIWEESAVLENGDMYRTTDLEFRSAGSYTVKGYGEPCKWKHKMTRYLPGEEYSMAHDQVHSIKFSRDAMVLFFEGPQISKESVIVEPYIDGNIIPTFKVEPWMFQKGT